MHRRYRCRRYVSLLWWQGKDALGPPIRRNDCYLRSGPWIAGSVQTSRVRSSGGSRGTARCHLCLSNIGQQQHAYPGQVVTLVASNRPLIGARLPARKLQRSWSNREMVLYAKLGLVYCLNQHQLEVDLIPKCLGCEWEGKSVFDYDRVERSN